MRSPTTPRSVRSSRQKSVPAPDRPGSTSTLATAPAFRFHWLRHTAISLMARAGMKPELIAERVGHRDGGGLIYRCYRHLVPSEIRAARRQPPGESTIFGATMRFRRMGAPGIEAGPRKNERERLRLS